jgi:hypothetical protein
MTQTRYALAAVLFAFVAQRSSAQSFVVEPASSCCGVFPDNVYLPGTVGGAPLYMGVVLGVDAISYGRPLAIAGSSEIQFSVSPASVGIPLNDVFLEAMAGEAAADIYTSSGDGSNAILFDGDGMSFPPIAAPPLGLLEAPAGIDNVNALDMRSVSPTGSIYFSVDPFTAAAYGGPPFGSAAHVYVAKAADAYDAAFPPPVIYASEADLGLAPFDDVDALTVFDDGDGLFGPADIIRFSLTPVSPSLGIGVGPATIFEVAGFGAIPAIATPAAALGLLATDDLDAIDAPEPSLLLLLGSGGFGVWFLHRRRGLRAAPMLS